MVAAAAAAVMENFFSCDCFKNGKNNYAVIALELIVLENEIV